MRRKVCLRKKGREMITWVAALSIALIVGVFLYWDDAKAAWRFVQERWDRHFWKKQEAEIKKTEPLVKSNKI